MKKYFFISLLFFSFNMIAASQATFRTIAPQQPVAIGEPFEVQYVMEGNQTGEEFTAPVFRDFHIVSGPYVYKGSVFHGNLEAPLSNSVYTLIATKTGKYLVPGAKTIMNGAVIKSNDVWIKVITKEEALKLRKRQAISLNNESEYFLQPGEDPLEKISRNLFLKAQVDKTSCYVGQPVVATFKLYSRLQSKSDIVKNPGFYGFAVYDMVNLADKKQETETINGKKFDVHTIRQVQLYPLQAGNFTIDAMEVSNEVEFSKDEINKKTEQEIVEGMAGADAFNKKDTNAEVYKNNIRSASIPITVKPLPAKNKPDTFSTAVGDFSINATLANNQLLKNEEGTFVLEIKGKGNFTQLISPSVHWPKGLEGFEPVLKDSLDKTSVPLAGNRVFKYGFISAKPGIYTIPALAFSFFDPEKSQYKRLTTQPLQVQISYREKENKQADETAGSNTSTKYFFYWWIAAGALILAFCAWVVMKIKRNKAKQKQGELLAAVAALESKALQVDSVLQPARIMMQADDKSFYTELDKSIWNYLGHLLNISGSEMSRNTLVATMKEKQIEENLINDLTGILNQCEMGIYAGALIADNKQKLFDKAKVCLKAINEKINLNSRKKLKG